MAHEDKNNGQENNGQVSTGAEDLLQKLAALTGQSPEQSFNATAPVIEEPDKNIFSSSLDFAGNIAKKPLEWGWDVLDTFQSTGSLKLYEMLGGRDSAEDVLIRERLSKTNFFDFGARRKIQNDRPAMWFGEKIQTTILADPLTYLGFGLAGKIPLFGKLLGPLEQGYMMLVNRTTQAAVRSASSIASVPFGLVARASTKFGAGGLDGLQRSGAISEEAAVNIRGLTLFDTQSLAVKTSRIRDEVNNGAIAFFDRFSGEAASTINDPAITQAAIKSILRVNRGELQEKGFDGAVLLRDTLDTGHLSFNALKQETWVKSSLDSLGWQLDAGKQMAINDTFNMFLRKESGFDTAVADLLRIVGGNQLDSKIVDDVGMWLTRAKEGQEVLINRVAALSPVEAAAELGHMASKAAADEIHAGISTLRTFQGMWGGFLNNIDAIYSNVWRSGIEKFALKPMSEAVLASPAYPIGNLIEDIYSVSSGGAFPSMLNVDEFSRAFQGVADPFFARLRTSGREGIGDVAGVLGAKTDDEFHVIPQGKFRWLGKAYLDVSTWYSENLRRGYTVTRFERNVQRNVANLAEVEDDVARWAELANNPPVLNSQTTRDELTQAAFIFGTGGDANGLRNISARFTSPVLREAEMLKHMALYTDLHPTTRKMIESAIKKGDYNRLMGRTIDNAIKNEQVQIANSVESQREWLDVIANTITDNPPQTPADMAALMLDFNKAVHQAQGIMHSNMAATFELLGDKFGLVEKKAFEEAYSKALELRKLLEEKIPQIGLAYEKAANTMGISVYESKAAMLKLAQLNGRFWDADIAAHDKFFSRGKASALEWRVMRRQIWLPFQSEFDKAMDISRTALMMDTVQSGVTTSDINAVLAKIDSSPLSQVLRAPSGSSQRWTEAKTSLEKARVKLAELVDSSPISNAEELAIKQWAEQVVSQVDSAPLTQLAGFPRPTTANELLLKAPKIGRGSSDEPLILFRGTSGGKGGLERGVVEESSLPFGKHVLHTTPDEQLAATFGDETKAYYVRGDKYNVFDMDGLASDIPSDARESMMNDLFMVGDDIDEAFDSAGAFYEAYAAHFRNAGRSGKEFTNDVLKENGVKIIKSSDPMEEFGILDDSILEGIPGGARAVLSEGKQPTELGTKLRKQWDDAIERTKIEGKQAFTNYSDQDGLDFAMKHIFPFWTYAKNIWPRIIANGIQHPLASKLMAPEGAFWNNTDGGYIPISIGGVQFAPYRGLGINRIINATRGQFPTQQSGLLGGIESELDRVQQWGFYPGFPFQTAMSAVNGVFGDGGWNPGEQLPPLWDFIAQSSLSAGAAFDIEGTEKVYNALHLGRFNEAAERRVAFGMKLDPENLTPEDKREVIQRLGAFNTLNNAITMFRFRPEYHQEYKEAFTKALAHVANTTVENLDEFRDNGEDYFDKHPLTPFQRQDLRNIMSDQFGEVQSQYYSVNAPFKTDAERELSVLKRSFFDSYDGLKVSQQVLQVEDDKGLNTGNLPANIWRGNLAERSHDRGLVRETLMESLELTEEDFTAENMSDVDLIIDVYYSVNPEKYEAEFTRFVNWEEVENERNRRLSNYQVLHPDVDVKTLLAEFLEFQGQNETDTVRKFRMGAQVGYYDWWDTDKAITWFTSGDLARTRRLMDIKNASDATDITQRIAIATGQPKALITVLGRTPGEAVIAQIMQTYRRELLKTKPTIDSWLRTFYNIAPS
jgi:hypothetical protein